MTKLGVLQAPNSHPIALSDDDSWDTIWTQAEQHLSLGLLLHLPVVSATVDERATHKHHEPARKAWC